MIEKLKKNPQLLFDYSIQFNKNNLKSLTYVMVFFILRIYFFFISN